MKPKIEGKTFRLPVEAVPLLARLRKRLSERAAFTYTQPMALVASLKLADAFLSDEAMQRMADMMTAKTNANTVGIVKKLLGEDVEVEQSEDGRTYTFSLRGKSVIVADNSEDLQAAFGRNIHASMH